MKGVGNPEAVVELPTLKRGCRGRVVAINGDTPTQTRLRELGLYEESEIRVLHVNGSVMCQVNDSRFGIDCQTARSVLVRPLN
ncbi:MAG: FeoA family protein [Verrucomicrobiales bacterium]|nr:FeoA family protein [Verrucomicrobiales bacterium]